MEELVKRNIVISERDVTTSRFETCQLHDMMREVCLLKAEEENFLQIVHEKSTAKSKAPCKSRRLAVHQCDKTFNVERKMNNPKLRSLLFINERWKEVRMCSSLFFDRLQLMRVLDLSRADFKGGKLPSTIGGLIHLRYLSLYMAHVTHLPSSMQNLKLLLYLNIDLRVKAGSSIYMPNFLKEMQELTYVYLPRILHDEVKMELGDLVNLEILHNFSTKNGSVRDLQGMTRLRELSIFLYRHKGFAMETLSSSLSELRDLESLRIQDYSPRKDKEGLVLDSINLKELDLSIYMPRLSDEQHIPSQLTTINLKNCRLEEDPMPVLEKLLHLKEIKLWERSFVGRRMVCLGGGFPQLQKLYLCGLDEWEEWIVEEGSMQLLHTLKIHQCEKLKELPDGLRFITSLKNLSVPLQNYRDFSQGGEDYHKIQQTPPVTLHVCKASPR
ncbi:unnamed protein product [Microthlaspi erraticum]|uniref:Disease resistance R13L4/SHOC-2-like LRR domain-containing protein n=1 Tax=Microthlaspi erraticum TaxID=1685480 RepID=A0A6D2JZX2_9BRAS|nr:unnamed protein product [Microthlaspi erraticum]